MYINLNLSLNGEYKINVDMTTNGIVTSKQKLIGDCKEDIKIMNEYFEISFKSEESKTYIYNLFMKYFTGNSKEETDKNLIKFIEGILDSFYIYVKMNTAKEIASIVSVELTIIDEYMIEETQYCETYEGEMYPYSTDVPEQELLFNYTETRKTNN